MNLLERIEQLVIRYPEKDTQIAQYDYKTRTTSMVPSKDYTELYFEMKILIHDDKLKLMFLDIIQYGKKD
jgi:hypothetical protein